MAGDSFKTFNQISDMLIEEKGLEVADPDALKAFVARTNYCRFLGYAREFQIDPRYGDDRFISGTTFDSIREIMSADSRMRELLLSQLSVVEIAIRSMVAHEYGRIYGERAFYLDIDFYNTSTNFYDDRAVSIIGGILSDLERDKSNMVSRYANSDIDGSGFENRLLRYANVPIWVAVEVMSFGRISNLITYVKDVSPVKEVAMYYGLQWAPFASVVHSLSVLRNLCAHHRQLWNRRMGIPCPVQKKLKPRNVKFDPASAYCQVIMLNHYRSQIDGSSFIAQEIASLLEAFPAYSKGFRIPNSR